MKKYSWHTTTFNIINRYTNTINYARYSDKVADGINKMWLEGFYKPNRKGGHTHNHLYNTALRKVFRSKDRRGVNNNEKRHFRKVWEINLKIGYHNSFCEFMEARAKRIKESM